MMTTDELYAQANDLGEVFSLTFWIHRPGYGPHDRVCGEVVIRGEQQTVCPEPWGTEHEH